MTWGAILHLVHQVQPKTVLDIGPGFGKAAPLLREYVGCPPIERIDAIEAHEPYVSDRMRCNYDQVHIADALKQPTEFFAPYDVVILGDVIEHFTKPDGRNLIRRIPGYVVICTPQEFFDNPPTNRWEKHRSLWTLADFEQTGRLEADLSQFGGVIVRLGRIT